MYHIGLIPILTLSLRSSGYAHGPERSKEGTQIGAIIQITVFEPHNCRLLVLGLCVPDKYFSAVGALGLDLIDVQINAAQKQILLITRLKWHIHSGILRHIGQIDGKASHVNWPATSRHPRVQESHHFALKEWNKIIDECL